MVFDTSSLDPNRAVGWFERLLGKGRDAAKLLQVYEKARDNLHRMIQDGILVQDRAEKLYIYREVMAGRTQTQRADQTDLASVRRHLVDNGIVDEDVFDRFVDEGRLPEPE